jgi:hypothetical protein
LLEVGTRLKHMMSSFFVRWQISIGGWHFSLFRIPQLYALFKQGSQDPPFNPDDKPGTFDFKVRPTKSYQQSLPSALQ